MRAFSRLGFAVIIHLFLLFGVRLSSHGDLVVILQPPEVALAGGSWSIQQEQWHGSGESTFLPAGNHTLHFASLSGWAAPSPWPLQVAVAGQDIMIIATYSKLTPVDCIFHLQFTVTGSQSGRRHPLSVTVLENAAAGYEPQEDIADYIPVPDNWSTISLQTEHEGNTPKGLLWQTKAWHPKCVWQLRGKLCSDDQLLLDWQHAVFPDAIVAFLDGDILPDTIDLTAQTNCILSGAGNFCLQLHVCHDSVECIVHAFDAGWNTFGIAHQLLSGSEKALLAMRPLLWDAKTQVFRQGSSLAPGQAGWIFSPQKQTLQSLGVEMPAQWTEIGEDQKGWQFGMVANPKMLPPELQAWKWEKGTFVLEQQMLWPGEVYWSWMNEKNKNNGK